MVAYTEILHETPENIQRKLNVISSPYDDVIFLDLSLNTTEYRIVEKENKEYFLYIVYKKLGLLGAFSNYKAVFSYNQVEDVTRIDGKIKLKTFTMLGLAFWFSAWGVILAKELFSKNPSSAYSTALMGVVIITWLVVEYFFFKKKVKDFFVLLEQVPVVADS